MLLTESGLNNHCLSNYGDIEMIDMEKLHNALLQMKKRPLKEPYKSKWTPQRPTTGYCYIVSKVIWYYCARDCKPYYVKMGNNETHWFLKCPNGKRLDYTKDQYDTPIPYGNEIARAFRNPNLSKYQQQLATLLGLEPRNKR